MRRALKLVSQGAVVSQPKPILRYNHVQSNKSFIGRIFMSLRNTELNEVGTLVKYIIIRKFSHVSPNTKLMLFRAFNAVSYFPVLLQQITRCL